MKARDEYTDLMEAYMQVCEQQMPGVPIQGNPSATTAKKTLEYILNVTGNRGKVVLPEPDPSKTKMVKQAEEYSVYDEVLEYLLGEGYSEDESNEIMVALVNENIIDDLTRAGQLFRYMTGLEPIPKLPVSPPSGPANLRNIYRGSTPQPPQRPPAYNMGPGKPPASTTPKTPKLPFDPLSAASGLLNIGRGTTPAGVAAAVSQIQGSTPQSGPRSPTSPEARAARSQRFAQLGFGGRYIPPSQQVPSTPVRPSTQQPTQRTTSVPPAPTLPSPRELNARSGRGVAPTLKVSAPKVSVPTPKPQDPDIAEYQRLQKIGDYKAADKLGQEIFSRTSGRRLTPPRVSPAFTQIPPNVA